MVSSMSDFTTQADPFSSKKLKVLDLLLKKKGIPVLQAQPIPRRTGPGPYPLSFAQQRFWFLEQWTPGNSIYNEALAFRLKGLLNLTALEQSLSEIGRRHEILRTTFLAVDGQPFQIIVPDMPLPLAVLDLQTLPETEREVEAQRLVTEEVKQPFDLARGPLLRVKLLRLAPKEDVLLLTMHHIISDGWSFEVLLREMAALYSAYCAGRPSSLPELSIQYADFALWQQQWLQSEKLEFQLNFWKRQLGGQLPVLELPTDRLRPPIQTYRGARQSLVLSPNLIEALKALSQREGTTLFMALLAAFKTLLYRYTSQVDIMVGVPVAGRNEVELEQLIGFFVNMLVLRTDLSGNPTFRELLGRVRQVALEAYAHQDVPFEKLIEELQPEREMSRPPFFQVFFNWLNFTQAQLKWPGLSLSLYDIDSRVARFDVTFYIIEETERLTVTVDYNVDLFDAMTITQMLSHFETLLASIVTNLEQRLSTLPLLTETERCKLSNHTQLVHPTNPFISFRKEDIEQAIPDRFEQQVRKYPERIAVKMRSHTLTYAALNQAANRVGRALLAQRRTGEEPVALLFDQSISLILTIMGVLKAGKIYVPLEPSYPPERLTYILQDSQAGLILTDNKNLTLARQLAGQTCLVINVDEIDSHLSTANLGLSISPDTLTYILYTSGSTGQPKGVVQNHRNVLHFIMNYTNGLHIQADDRLSLLPACSFSAAAMDIFAALLNGAAVFPFNLKKEGTANLASWLIGEEITIYHSVPTVFRSLLMTLMGEEQFPKLRLIDLGGETVYQRDVELYKKYFSADCLLVNGYGCTELNVARQYFINKDTQMSRSVAPVGYAVEDTEILLLAETGEEVGLNRMGEIAIKSRYLCPGYWRKPDLTQAAFRSDPAGGNEKVYYTGDMGRMLADGCLIYHGRRDFQVKVRGHRVEVAEIEMALLGHPAVKEAVVVAQEDVPTDKHLVAYLVPKEPAPTISELHCFLKEKLPDYMLPSTFVMQKALPLTSTGKIDRHILPPPDPVRPNLNGMYVAPRTPVEQRLAGIWIQLLRLEQVGVHDNFFELGGHSLLAIQVISRLREAFQVELSLRNLFEAPTVASLAERIEAICWLKQGLRVPGSLMEDDREEIEL
ncbi:MAG: amino acid adenylation domain-containing protein [Anaerolineales bacterium]|nr:amino acid adenylation domain-containing protein [Anaerolineales bacterium]